MPSDIRRCHRKIPVENTHSRTRCRTPCTHMHIAHTHKEQDEDTIFIIHFFLFISWMKLWLRYVYGFSLFLHRWNDDLTFSSFYFSTYTFFSSSFLQKFELLNGNLVKKNISKESVTHRMCLCIQLAFDTRSRNTLFHRIHLAMGSVDGVRRSLQWSIKMNISNLN